MTHPRDISADRKALSHMCTHAQRIAEYSIAALWSDSQREHLVQLASIELDKLAAAAGFRLVPVEAAPSEDAA